MVAENPTQKGELWMVNNHQWDSFCVLILTHGECLRPTNIGGSIDLLLYIHPLITSVEQVFFEIFSPP